MTNEITTLRLEYRKLGTEEARQNLLEVVNTHKAVYVIVTANGLEQIYLFGGLFDDNRFSRDFMSAIDKYDEIKVEYCAPHFNQGDNFDGATLKVVKL